MALSLFGRLGGISACSSVNISAVAVRFIVEKLREVKSTVHITGQQTEDTKAALQRLLRSSNKTTSSTQRDAPHPCYCHLHVSVSSVLNTSEGGMFFRIPCYPILHPGANEQLSLFFNVPSLWSSTQKRLECDTHLFYCAACRARSRRMTRALDLSRRSSPSHLFRQE